MDHHTAQPDIAPATVSPPQAAQPWLTVDRVKSCSAIMLILFCTFLLLGAIASHGFTNKNMTGPGVDFSVFWGASHISLQHGPLHAYDPAQMMQAIREHGTLDSGSKIVMPWLYPPTFLLLIIPLALLPFWPSYVLFVLATGTFYVKAAGWLLGVRSVWRQGVWLPIVASPAVFVSGLLGQNSLLTAALAGTGVYLLKKRPVLAGVAIGLLVIKPQLAILFPLALLAARAWKALASVALTAMSLTAISVAVCGWETIPAFLQNARWAQSHLLDNGGVAWQVMPTVLAAARSLGLSVTLAYALHLIVAGLAVIALLYVWLRTTDTGLRVAMLAMATMLTSPYLRVYELTWLGLAIAGYVGAGIHHGLSRSERIVLATAWLLALFEFINPLLHLPQIGPIVLLAVAFMIVRRVVRLSRRQTAASADPKTAAPDGARQPSPSYPGHADTQTRGPHQWQAHATGKSS
ncbi:glycosyltransferase family 87 protein [Ralstonia insidiosa]|jgi:alpha-1,2-mannosyltransferase|uniref:glycosyltransferase family 87 protein n=3 Tax=Pseudomonadota TaxID=1224 RepID=UPI0009E35F73|nr:glycosyltransferase family 87 protein [Ralstonia insidiosa]MBX3774483.1 DUF2029 domain-containing protein [Ralstonia pickettii]NOZ16413.1 DUF2029 domain-containing protein [Betaproteobacteria bacterium]MBA9859027.1 DUF2029 domain-containing protein [Ralstonia insidiosa]MBA9873511.1 DUF2029 domain-containing protein [Ralstonia insidiosa]MBA9915348.1 DUF2029 domain-containing protein [Ralstonia insidiosa]